MDAGFDMSVFDSTSLPDSEIEECKKRFESGGVEGCRRFLQRKQDEWKDVPLNVAVIGNSGVGKSSFINAIRRLTADDDGGAAVGVTECTDTITGYAHPHNPNLIFWDVPGVGTDTYPSDGYMEEIKADRYDFFLLMSATRFTENDTWLGQEIINRRRKFFFVRTKLGPDMSSNKKSHPRSHSEDKVIATILQDIRKHLTEAGSSRETPQIFLIDNYIPQKFNFEELERRLIEDFPELKRSSMILSMCAYSQQMVRLKVKELRSRIWKAALLSAGVAAIPVPGLSMVVDGGILMTQAKFFFEQLGLDDNSLRTHARVMNVKYERLKTIVESKVGPAFLTAKGIAAFVKLLPAAALAGVSMAAEEFTRAIPFIGSAIAAGISLGTTAAVLYQILNHLEKVALQVVTYASEHSQVNDSDDD